MAADSANGTENERSSALPGRLRPPQSPTDIYSPLVARLPVVPVLPACSRTCPCCPSCHWCRSFRRCPSCLCCPKREPTVPLVPVTTTVPGQGSAREATWSSPPVCPIVVYCIKSPSCPHLTGQRFLLVMVRVDLLQPNMPGNSAL